MPDPAKFDRLREVGYTIPNVCSFCTHGNFKPGTEWGTCGLHRYEHGKHTGPDREMSIVRMGRCRDGFEENSSKTTFLGPHAEFR